MEKTEKKYLRQMDDVRKVLQHAKLDESTLLPVTQALYFPAEETQYKFLELNEELLDKLKNGIPLTFRGNKEDKAVLCTDDKTYEVKEVETSNSLLLIPDLKFPEEMQSLNCTERILEHKDVINVFHTYYEVKLSKPKLKRLRTILNESSYRGSELESELVDSGVKMYSTNELLDVIQASEVELKNALSKMQAFELNDKWRILEFSYHVRVLSYFLNLIDEQSWNHEDIPADEVDQILSEIVPSNIINYILLTYCENCFELNGKRHVRLIENKVCRIIGEELLKPTTTFEFNDFLRAWQGSVPEGLITNICQLDGLVYIDNQLNRKVIHYCPEYELSEDIAERIQYLFTLKEKWTFEEIKPYIEVFTTEKMDENAILTKYARASKLNEIRVYSSKHGK
ncbi:hypothetical protein PGB90_000235 [Kerria lacca]